MSKGLDSAKSVLNVVDDLAAKGYNFIARYYFHQSGFKDVLTYDEAHAISSAGMWNVAVYENGYPTTVGYFTSSQGAIDAGRAVACAHTAHQPTDTPIYFAVDYDSNPDDVKDYFEAVHPIVRAAGYVAGIYGNGTTIEAMKSAGLISYGWLSQSRGFSGYDEEKAEADIVQLPEGTVDNRDVDGDTASGHSGAWKV